MTHTHTPSYDDKKKMSPDTVKCQGVRACMCVSNHPHWKPTALSPTPQLGDPQHSLGHLQDLALFWRGPLQTLNHQPAALVVLDVCADLTRHAGVPKEIKVIILGREGSEKKERRGCKAGKEQSWSLFSASAPCLPTWIWKNSPISSRIFLAWACSFSPSMPAYSEKGVNKSYARGACIFLAASSHEEGLAPVQTPQVFSPFRHPWLPW